MLRDTKEIIPGEKENKIIEEVDEDTNQSQSGNILLNPLNTLVNTRIKIKIIKRIFQKILKVNFQTFPI